MPNTAKPTRPARSRKTAPVAKAKRVPRWHDFFQRYEDARYEAGSIASNIVEMLEHAQKDGYTIAVATGDVYGDAYDDGYKTARIYSLENGVIRSKFCVLLDEKHHGPEHTNHMYSEAMRKAFKFSEAPDA